MNKLNAPELSAQEKVEIIKRCVRLDDLIRDSYNHLWRQIVPQQDKRYKRLPSPCRQPGDDSNSVILFVREGVWYWSDPLAPSQIPRDVIGFSMLFDKRSYEEAVEKLWGVSKRFREYRALDGAHLRVVSPVGADDIVLAELHHTRERIVAMGGTELGELIASPTRAKRKRNRSRFW